VPLRVILLVWCLVGASQSIKALPQLTQAAEVRALTPEQAAAGYPVKLRGVITDAVPKPDLFVQDKSAGIYIEGNRHQLFPHQLGDLVEIVGVSGPGRFAPVVKEISSRIIHSGAHMPTTRIYNFAELANGVMDSQWIQIRGIIRSASVDSTSWSETVAALTVDSGGGQFKARIPLGKTGNLAAWIGQEALFSGVCGSLFNQERQFTGVLLYVPSIDFVSIESRAEIIHIPELLRFSPLQGDGRVRVQGTISYIDPQKFFCIQDGDRGMRVHAQEEPALSVGDRVEVLGWPTLGESAPIVTSSSVRKLGRAALPKPVTFNFPRTQWSRYDGTLIQLEADLTGISKEGSEPVLQLRRDNVAFTASLKNPPNSNSGLRHPLPRLGSHLQLTGICLVRNGGLWRSPQSFQMLLRSPKDINVLSEPPLWNLQSAGWVLEALLASLVLVVAWMLVIRRSLKAQVQVLREKLQRGAVLEERNRIARELHDTLEQDLAGITLHLDLAADCFKKAPEQARQALNMARQMSRHSMVEARRSVWDLRSHLLEHGTLSSALASAVEPLLARSAAKLHVRVNGKTKRLSSTVEMNVLRIGQEAITNAMKHAGASRIDVVLTYHAHSLELTVTDDGCGFDEKTAVFAGGGHFGLLDMKERAHLVGSQCKIRSRPGYGTAVEVQIPIGTLKSIDERSESHTNPGS
jgi:signal transduction histidine kinase